MFDFSIFLRVSNFELVTVKTARIQTTFQLAEGSWPDAESLLKRTKDSYWCNFNCSNLFFRKQRTAKDILKRGRLGHCTSHFSEAIARKIVSPMNNVALFDVSQKAKRSEIISLSTTKTNRYFIQGFRNGGGCSNDVVMNSNNNKKFHYTLLMF